MNILQDSSLLNFNSFGVNHKSKYLIKIENRDDISNVINNKDIRNEKKLIIGGGSNILFTKDFDGIVLVNKIMGIDKFYEDENIVKIKVGSGENWDEFVSYCVENSYYGVENLSLIPGSVGAAPIQNIGAYGQEVSNLIKSVDCYDYINNKFSTIYIQITFNSHQTTIFSSTWWMRINPYFRWSFNI